MFLTKYLPFQDFNEMDNRFKALERSFFNDDQMQISGFAPTVNTREGEFAYHIDADLPGVKKEDIKLQIAGNVLTISGERHFKKEVTEKDFHKVESSFGKFERSFTLPKGVDTENITASNEDGVLEVTIPKLKHDVNYGKNIKIT